MDDPAFLWLQIQENARFLRPYVRIVSATTWDHNRTSVQHPDGEPFYAFVILDYDQYGNVKAFPDYEDWTNQPLQALRTLNQRLCMFVGRELVRQGHPSLEDQRAAEAHAADGGSDDSPPPSEPDTPRGPEPHPVSEPHLQRPSYPGPLQPRSLGPAHYPQPSPRLGSAPWSPGPTTQSSIVTNPWATDPHNDTEAVRSMDQQQSRSNVGLGNQRVQHGSTQSQSHTSGSVMNIVNGRLYPSNQAVARQQVEQEMARLPRQSQTMGLISSPIAESPYQITEPEPVSYTATTTGAPRHIYGQQAQQQSRNLQPSASRNDNLQYQSGSRVPPPPQHLPSFTLSGAREQPLHRTHHPSNNPSSQSQASLPQTTNPQETAILHGSLDAITANQLRDNSSTALQRSRHEHTSLQTQRLRQDEQEANHQALLAERRRIDDAIAASGARTARPSHLPRASLNQNGSVNPIAPDHNTQPSLQNPRSTRDTSNTSTTRPFVYEIEGYGVDPFNLSPGAPTASVPETSQRRASQQTILHVQSGRRVSPPDSSGNISLQQKENKTEQSGYMRQQRQGGERTRETGSLRKVFRNVGRRISDTFTGTSRRTSAPQ